MPSGEVNGLTLSVSYPQQSSWGWEGVSWRSKSMSQ